MSTTLTQSETNGCARRELTSKNTMIANSVSPSSINNIEAGRDKVDMSGDLVYSNIHCHESLLKASHI